MFGARCGVAAALALALYPPAIFYDGLVQKAALASFLLCALLYLISLANLGRRQMIAAAACGVCLGLLCLTRENALIWSPILVLWFLLSTDKTTTEPAAANRQQVNWRTMMPNRRSIQSSLGFLAGPLVVILPGVAPE
jgi:asparagine N-glycosylation enzyme membrane subunit Stt3